MSKSTDQKVTADLIETLEDGRRGFAEASEKLTDTDRPDLASRFAEFARQRASFSEELTTMAASYGDRIDENGSLAAAAHRGWMNLKDAVTGTSAKGVLDVASSGEDHALDVYRDALDSDISIDLRNTVSRQFEAVSQVANEVKALSSASQ